MCMRTVLVYFAPMDTCVSQKDNKCSAVAEMRDRLATIDMGRKLAAVPILQGELVPV